MSLVEHETAVQQKLTERYLLNELDPDVRNAFEEHYFDCPECAFDVQAGVAFVEQSKRVLADAPKLGFVPVRPPDRGPAWLAWLRPMWAAPALAVLLAVVGYQNLFVYPQLKASNQPQQVPWVSVNLRTMGSETRTVNMHPGQGFVLFVSIPTDDGYVRYLADLYSPEGKLDSALPIPASSNDQRAVYIPAATRHAGTYTLAVRGETSVGAAREIGRESFELQIQ